MALFDSLVLKLLGDSLERRFSKAFLLFNKSVESRQRKEVETGFASEFLFLMAAAETMLLGRNDSKRLRLSYLLPLFGRPSGISQEEGYVAVNECYNWRSSFVHSGEDVYPGYDEIFSQSKSVQYLYLVRKMVARLLIMVPESLDLTESRLQGKNAPKSGRKAREKEWLRYINECWRAAFTEDRKPPGLA
jgi:hypothetical protein